MGVYRPTIDLPGTGRITLVRERLVDLTTRGKPDSLDPATRPADARAAVLLHQAVLDTPARGLVETIDLPEKYFLYPPYRPPIPEPTFPAADGSRCGREIDARVGYPAWTLSFSKCCWNHIGSLGILSTTTTRRRQRATTRERNWADPSVHLPRATPRSERNSFSGWRPSVGPGIVGGRRPSRRPYR